MIIRTTISKFGVDIRLTFERWTHIIENHNDLAGMQDYVMDAVSNPDEIRDGDYGEYIAISKLNRKDYLVVPYQENGNDGFITTAFITDDKNWIEKKAIIWK